MSAESGEQNELCTRCPNRGQLSRILARIAGNETQANGCEGVTTVAHGRIITQTRTGGEASPPQREWTSMTSLRETDERRYSRTEWTYETVCGRESIEPGQNEVPYDPSEPVHIGERGKRIVAFISGSEDDIRIHRSSLAVMRLLDLTTELQIAEAADDAEAVERATHEIGAMGFEKPITAGRDDGRPNK